MREGGRWFFGHRDAVRGLGGFDLWIIIFNVDTQFDPAACEFAVEYLRDGERAPQAGQSNAGIAGRL